jgi:hypothetical protein
MVEGRKHKGSVTRKCSRHRPWQGLASRCNGTAHSASLTGAGEGATTNNSIPVSLRSTREREMTLTLIRLNMPRINIIGS